MFQFSGGVSSRIIFEAVRPDGTVRETIESKNIFTATGLAHWAGQTLGSQLAVGYGSRVENESVTSLSNFAKSQSGTWTYSEVNVIDTTNGVMRTDHLLTVTYPVETSNQNYSEVGIHSGNQNQLQTYALIRDANGDPTAMSILEGEQLRVFYFVQFNTPLLHSVEKMMNGVMTTVTTVPLATGENVNVRLPNTPATATRFYAAGQSIPSPGVAPSGGVQGPRAATIANGLYNISVDPSELNLTGGIALIRMGGTENNVGIMVHFDPPVNKTSAFSMTVGVTTTLSNGVFYA